MACLMAGERMSETNAHEMLGRGLTWNRWIFGVLLPLCLGKNQLHAALVTWGPGDLGKAGWEEHNSFHFAWKAIILLCLLKWYGFGLAPAGKPKRKLIHLRKFKSCNLISKFSFKADHGPWAEFFLFLICRFPYLTFCWLPLPQV